MKKHELRFAGFVLNMADIIAMTPPSLTMGASIYTETYVEIEIKNPVVMGEPLKDGNDNPLKIGYLVIPASRQRPLLNKIWDMYQNFLQEALA